MNETFLQQLRRLSIERAKNGFKTYDNQPITYWTTAIVGELGELCNMIKKMKRAENGGHDSGHSYTAKSITPKMLREEVGGTLIYIDLLCSVLGIDLQEAITETFNEKSVELGFPYLLESTPPVSAMEDGWVKVEDGCEMPEVGSQVLITVDYSEWGKNERRIFIANVHFAGELRPYGGPNSLTGSGFLTGIYFSVPHIPNPDAVTHWKPLPPPPSK